MSHGQILKSIVLLFIACECDHPKGAESITCNDDGQCDCKENFKGLKCNECKENYYDYDLGCLGNYFCL